MICKCQICGKTFDVLYPRLWRYKTKIRNRHNYQYFCSYSCIKEYDGEEENVMAMITLEMKKKAVEIALSGVSPIDYLRNECKVKYPESAWYKIKKNMKEINPELYGKIPDFRMKSEPEKPAELPIASPISPVVIETPETPKIVKPLAYGDYTVCCIESKTFGRFYWDRDHNHLDWTTGEGEEVSFTPQGWKMFLEELPKVAKLLGVKL